MLKLDSIEMVKVPLAKFSGESDGAGFVSDSVGENRKATPFQGDPENKQRFESSPNED